MEYRNLESLYPDWITGVLNPLRIFYWSENVSRLQCAVYVFGKVILKHIDNRCWSRDSCVIYENGKIRVFLRIDNRPKNIHRLHFNLNNIWKKNTTKKQKQLKKGLECDKMENERKCICVHIPYSIFHIWMKIIIICSIHMIISNLLLAQPQIKWQQ